LSLLKTIIIAFKTIEFFLKSQEAAEEIFFACFFLQSAADYRWQKARKVKLAQSHSPQNFYEKAAMKKIKRRSKALRKFRRGGTGRRRCCIATKRFI